MSYSANDNQNFFVQSGRTTSRVLATPGGECSIALGGYTPAELERMRQLREQRMMKNNINNKTVEEATISSTVLAKENSTNEEEASPTEAIATEEKPEAAEEAQSPEEEAATMTQPATSASPKKGLSSNAFASSSTTNSFNVLTDRPTSRVTNPPGGKDNLWF